MTDHMGRAGRVMVAVASIAIFGCIAGYLGLTHLGTIGSDPSVELQMADVGDQLGAGSKVRHRGLIVGRVVKVERDADSTNVKMRIAAESALRISRSVQARVLPSTVFGSDYIELLGAAPRPGEPSLRSGGTITVDASKKAVRLQNSMRKTLRLLESIDVESLATSTSTMARAVDGNGENIGNFIVRARKLAAELNDDAQLTVLTLQRTARVAKLFADLEPDLVSAAVSSRTTLKTISESEAQLHRLIVTATDLFRFSDQLLTKRESQIVRLLQRTRDPLATTAERRAAVRALLDRAPTVLHNGSRTVRDGAVRLRAFVGTDPLDPYTAADCPRYGKLAGPNCGRDNRQQNSQSSTELNDAEADALIESIEQLVGPRSTSADRQSSDPTKRHWSPRPLRRQDQIPASPLLRGLFEGLFGGTYEN